MVSAAMTVSWVLPISPNSARRRPMRWSKSPASRRTCASWPCSQAMRNLRPLMVTVTRDRSLLRDGMCCSALMGVQHGTDRADRGVKPPRDLPVGALERARTRHRGVEIARQPRAVVIKGMDLGHQIVLAEVDLMPLFRRPLERIKRKGKPPGGRFDRTGIRHRLIPPGGA